MTWPMPDNSIELFLMPLISNSKAKSKVRTRESSLRGIGLDVGAENWASDLGSGRAHEGSHLWHNHT